MTFFNKPTQAPNPPNPQTKWKLYQKKLKSLRTTLFHRTPPKPNPIDRSPFPFLRLPPEIRTQIYHLLLTVPDDGALWLRYSLPRQKWWDATPFCQSPGPRTPRPRVTLGLLLTCHTIREEALPILFRINKVWLDAPPGKCLEFLTSLPPTVSGGIREMKLWIDAYLNCGRATGNLPSFSPEVKEEHRLRVEDELLTPWGELFSWMQGNLRMLKTLHVWFGPGRSWHAGNLGAISLEWQGFYRRGWLEKIWEMRQVEWVLIEAQLEWCEQMEERDRESLRDLMGDVQLVKGFEEVSLEWSHFFFLSSACEQFPETSLCISLRRGEGLGLGELPEYKPIYTLNDMICPRICGFAEPQPPRSPNNCR
ncbi:hypothetical protein BO94DRAFT_536928 [Aspergillus sclerotioniger CBS 115572]|uniref:Uncharacterized protein n=1 Tax=Aspergillus sclerotioniger CBS 115572 TaxID=1450535 RepID=A0A317W502_9EURO|nr:hypothetical protein BO94DRAFT_536928 [Aspergillus sclerotioniger CBS 115572]PWY81706.1 hypothetical protein BO94DRAFT_536928 [Aspergillus sclerotioniger CBS 115572]